jgi:protein-cysteine N-palmitoyltransferase HHAT
MGLLVIFHPLLRRVYETLRPVSKTSPRPGDKANGSSLTYTSAADGNARMSQRASFDYWFALIFISALHGFSAFKVILLLCLNFSIATRLPRQYVPLATWIFNIGTLFANELCDGYKFAKIAEFVSSAGPGTLEKGTDLHNWGAWLDSYGGIMPRWEILFNITVLRLISYNMDYFWSLNRRAGSPVEVCIHETLNPGSEAKATC